MAKFIAIFNILSAAASLAGLCYALQLQHSNQFMAVAFVCAGIFSCYVLFTPANPVERNIATRLQHFRGVGDNQRSAVQRGTFAIRDSGPVSIQFHQPFIEPPMVKITHLPGESGRLPHVSEVSTLHAEFSRTSYSPGDKNTFNWIAHGKALEPIPDAKQPPES